MISAKHPALIDWTDDPAQAPTKTITMAGRSDANRPVPPRANWSKRWRFRTSTEAC